jgi:membrane protease YdiL (CAAX protease family)
LAPDVPERAVSGDARKYSLLGLTVFLTDKALLTIINITGNYGVIFAGLDVYSLTTVIFNWAIPIFILYRIERRGLDSVGLKVKSDRYPIYIALSFVGFVLPSFFLGFDSELIVEFLEQLAFIGLVEEFFYRGYLMGRFCEWLGDIKGLFLNAVVFSLAHLVFLFSRYGFTYLQSDLIIGFQTFMGGLLLGYIFLRAGDIIPSSILHISLNMYLSRL